MAWISFGALPCREKELDDSSCLDVVKIVRIPDMLPSLFPSRLGYGLISTLAYNATNWACCYISPKKRLSYTKKSITLIVIVIHREKIYYSRSISHTSSYKNLLEIKHTHKKLKWRLKNIIIDETWTYASEPWILTKRDRKQTNIFVKTVYRGILHPVKINKKENWRIFSNKEIYAMVKKPITTETIRLNRLCWFGHVQRMK